MRTETKNTTNITESQPGLKNGVVAIEVKVMKEEIWLGFMGRRAVNRNLENKHNRDIVAFGNLRTWTHEEILEQGSIREYLRKLDIHKSMGSDGMCP